MFPYDDEEDQNPVAPQAVDPISDAIAKQRSLYEAAKVERDKPLSKSQRIGLLLTGLGGGADAVAQTLRLIQQERGQRFQDAVQEADQYVNQAVQAAKYQRQADEERIARERGDPASAYNIAKVRRLAAAYGMPFEEVAGKLTADEFDDYRERKLREADLALREKERRVRQDENLGLRREAFLAREDERRDRARERVLDAFDKDPGVRKIRDQKSAAERGISMLAEAATNPVAAEAVKSMLARASGEVGAMTDQDIARFGGSRALAARATQAAAQLATGRLTEENRRFMTQVAEAMQRSADTALASRAKTLAKSRAKASGIDEADILDMLGYAPEPEAPSAAPVGKSGLTPEQRRARIQELQKRKGQ